MGNVEFGHPEGIVLKESEDEPKSRVKVHGSISITIHLDIDADDVEVHPNESDMECRYPHSRRYPIGIRWREWPRGDAATCNNPMHDIPPPLV